jgi:hypothetical protein
MDRKFTKVLMIIVIVFLFYYISMMQLHRFYRKPKEGLSSGYSGYSKYQQDMFAPNWAVEGLDGSGPKTTLLIDGSTETSKKTAESVNGVSTTLDTSLKPTSTVKDIHINREDKIPVAAPVPPMPAVQAVKVYPGGVNPLLDETDFQDFKMDTPDEAISGYTIYHDPSTHKDKYQKFAVDTAYLDELEDNSPWTRPHKLIVGYKDDYAVLPPNGETTNAQLETFSHINTDEMVKSNLEDRSFKMEIGKHFEVLRDNMGQLQF